MDGAAWKTDAGRKWRTAIVQLSDRVQVDSIDTKPLAEACGGGWASVDREHWQLRIRLPSGKPFIAVTVYGAWEKPHSITKSNFIFADASAHRLISDVSVFTSKRQRQNILVAGDLNILNGHGEHADAYWAGRYETVFSRMVALGLSFVGPQAPHGRQADPWPDKLPRESNNVPTYYARGQTPATCTRQLDFVLASERLASRVQVRALNEAEPENGDRAITAASK